jgi:alpha/beta superfamily hydrolase
LAFRGGGGDRQGGGQVDLVAVWSGEARRGRCGVRQRPLTQTVPAPAASAPAVATGARTDPATGVREVASFFGRGRDRLFGCRYLPPGEVAGGVVICCPLQAELLRNYRREVVLARRLAAQGIAVQRFHYRGSGHSDGETSAATFDTMLEDAQAAGDHLEEELGGRPLAFMGARFGGLVAAGAAEARGSHLTLWEPVVDPARYFEEVLRFRLMHDMKRHPLEETTNDALRDELHRTGSVDVLGHTLERSLHNSAVGRQLAGITPGGPTLIVQIGATRQLRREYASLADTWRRRGLHVNLQLVFEREAWWLSGDLWPVHETHAPTRKLVSLTVDWVVETLGARAP